MSLIDELPTHDDSDDIPIRTNYLKDIMYGSQIHPDINARDARLKDLDVLNNQKLMERSRTPSEEFGKCLNKLFHTVVNEINNALPTLESSGSEVLHLIPELRMFL